MLLRERSYLIGLLFLIVTACAGGEDVVLLSAPAPGVIHRGDRAECEREFLGKVECRVVKRGRIDDLYEALKDAPSALRSVPSVAMDLRDIERLRDNPERIKKQLAKNRRELARLDARIQRLRAEILDLPGERRAERVQELQSVLVATSVKRQRVALLEFALERERAAVVVGAIGGGLFWSTAAMTLWRH